MDGGHWIDDGIPVLTEAVRVERHAAGPGRQLLRRLARIYDHRFEVLGILAGSALAMAVLSLAIR